mgnify:CR=1 FL=1
MASFADSVREHALTDMQEKLELSEARNAALEARVSDLEEQLAKQAAESSKWKQMPPALVAMLGKQGMSNEEKAALEQLAGLGTEVAELRQTVHAQSEMLGEMSSDVEHMANGLYEPAVDASGPPGGSESVSPPTLDSNAPRTSSLARRNFLVTRMQKQLRKVEGVLTEGKGPLADQLKKLDRQVGEQIHTISSELRDLRTAHEETSQAHAAAEGSLAQMRDSMAADGGKPARGVRGWQGVDEPAPKLEGKGQLAMSLFVTGEGEPPTLDPQRHGFQPRRAQLNMTPGEQTLTPTFITRKRPTTAAGRLTGSASAGLLSVPRPGSGQQGKQ